MRIHPAEVGEILNAPCELVQFDCLPQLPALVWQEQVIAVVAG
ncbi:hypothetical protein MIZ03_4607 [Rhodoferax lithotrophicus]|uniref:Uncharacterized protein n=1 Tax=Rhodoferax lithotrophicus TaxID=2798804 RepID=A0ABN6DD62_9BURK|nr:hypothetical protein MIZ03_4607 [Rhodoferax sp. MIZ03]